MSSKQTQAGRTPTFAELPDLIPALESLNIGMWEWQIGDDQAVINPHYAHMLGYTHAELNPTTLTWLEDTMHPEDLPGFQERLEVSLRENSLLNLSFRLRHKQGHFVWVKSRGMVIERHQGEPLRMLGLHLSIDSLLEDLSLQDLQHSRVNDLVSSSPAVMYALEPTGNGGFDITYISRNTCDVVGVDMEHFANDQVWLALIHPDDQVHVWNTHERWLTSDIREPLLFRYRMQASDGSWQWLEDSCRKNFNAEGELVEVVGSFINVTRDVESTAILEQLASVVPGVIYQFQQDAGGQVRFQYVSSKIDHFFGFAAHELMDDASRLFEQIHPDDLDHVWQTIADSAHDGGVWRCDFRVTARQQERWMRGEARAQAQDGAISWHGLLVDISTEKQIERQLAEAHARLSRAQQLGRIGYWELNMDSGELFWSDVIYDIFGFDAQQTTPSIDLFNSCIHPDDVAAVRASEERARHTGTHDVEHRIIRPDGSIRWVHELANFAALKTGEGVLHGNVRDITETKELEQKLARQANRDQLTGLYNRRYLMQAGGQALSRCQREQKPFSLLMLDMDRFKKLNDVHGHAKGDEALRKVGGVLSQRVRASDIAARIGGEELVVALENANAAEARKVADELAEYIRQIKLQDESGQPVVLTASFGIATALPAMDISLDRLLVQADKAMYQAKQNGRDRVEVAPEAS